jgi:hypothetical protein
MSQLSYTILRFLSYFRYSAGDFTGQILQQCLDLIRYQPPANNLTIPSTMHGDHLTPGPNTDAHRDIELMRKRKHVSKELSHKKSVAGIS